MTYQPVVVGTGLVGWQFLKSTQENQREIFDSSFELQRDTDYFAENIRSVTTAEELVNDRRLLRVALGAFGLQDDIDNKFFIQKILEEGVTETDSLANRLADERYKSIAEAFSFDSVFGPRTQLSFFAEEIIPKFQAQEFEVAIGEQDNTLRLALNLERNLPEISSEEVADDTKWFRLMGNPPMREVFEIALGLPSSFGQLDIDKQLEVFRDKSQSRFGVSEIDELTDPEVMDRIVQTYFLQNQVQNFQASGAGQVALSLLQSIPRTSILDIA